MVMLLLHEPEPSAAASVSLIQTDEFASRVPERVMAVAVRLFVAGEIVYIETAGTEGDVLSIVKVLVHEFASGRPSRSRMLVPTIIV